jgi:hypothetical protein
MGNFMINSIFYLCSLPFIWVEIFQLRNRGDVHRLDLQQFEPKKWILFYILKIAYIFWIFLGLFTENYPLFGTMMLLSCVKFLVVRTKSNFYINLYDLLSFIASVALLIWSSFLGVALLLL